MLEKFTERTQRVLELAERESAGFNHTHIDPAHVLLGLIREGRGIGGYLLKNCFHVDLEKARQKVKELLKGSPSSSTETINYAAKESRARNASYIGTEHLLLGILKMKSVVVAQILEESGCSPEDVRKEVLATLKHTK